MNNQRENPSTARSFYCESSGHHSGNKGDIAMLKSLIGILEENYPGSRYYIPLECDPSYFNQADVKSFVPLEDYVFADNIGPPSFMLFRPLAQAGRWFYRLVKLIRIILAARKISKSALSQSLPPEVMENLRAMKNSQVVFVSGGGCLNDIWKVAVFIRAGLVPLLARVMKKPVILTGCGFGPLKNRWLHLWLRFCLKKVHYIGVRDGLTSPAILRQLMVPSEKIKITGDDAFPMVADAGREEIRKHFGMEPERLVIGFNARLKSYNQDAQHYFQNLLEIIKTVASQLQAVVLFIASDFGPSRYNDLATARHAQELLGESVEFKYLDEPVEPERIKSLAAACDLVLAQSYHVLVFALSAQVPAIGLYHSEYYAGKTQGLFQFVGLENNALGLENLSVEQAARKILTIYRDQNCKIQLQAANEKWHRLHKDWENNIVSVIENTPSN